MTTVLATRRGSVRPGTTAVVAATTREWETLAVERPADNEYYLPPGLVERVGASGADRVVIDGLVHQGQMVDLGERLPAIELLDRRDLLVERLADGGNEVAETAAALRRRRIDLRESRRRQRGAAAGDPSGESGRVADLETACERLESDLADRCAQTRRQIETSYQGVDAHAVVVGPLDAATTGVWSDLTGVEADSAVLRPATPRTAVLDIGAHEVAVTDTPGLPADHPEWFTEGVPGTVAALDRADVVVIAGDGFEIPGRDETTVIRADPGTQADRGERLRAEIRDALPAARLTVTLPYGAESVLSALYDEGSVENVTYDEAIEATVTVPASERARITELVENAGGVVESG